MCETFKKKNINILDIKINVLERHNDFENANVVFYIHKNSIMRAL